MKVGLVILLVLFGAAPVHGQGVIAGRVVDAETGAALPDVMVRAIAQDGTVALAVMSDSGGSFALPLRPGEYALLAERLGYESLTTAGLRVRRAERVDVELRLGMQPVAIEPLVVRSRQRTPVGADAFYRRMERWKPTGQGRYITRSDIEATTVGSLGDLLTRDPNLFIVRDPVLGELLHFEGRGRTCGATVFLNGIRVIVPDVTNYLHHDDLEGVEIYPSATQLPGELMTPGSCGVVAFWTRSGRGNPFTLRQIGIAGAFVVLGALFVSM